jgi:hypothetical protein
MIFRNPANGFRRCVVDACSLCSGGVLTAETARSKGAAMRIRQAADRYSKLSHRWRRRLLADSTEFSYSNFTLMATPCKKCGAEKTEDVRHGLLYSLAKAFGYRLRMCSRCHRLRLVPRHPKPSVEKPTPAPDPAPDPASRPPVMGACPKCGKVDFRRSRRLIWERLIFRGPMARCRACRARFPLPQPIDAA